MVAINYTLQVTEMGPMKPEHRTRKALAEGSCRSLELSLFDSSATVRDLKYSVVEHLGCPAVVEVWGPKIAEVGSDVGLCPYSSRCSELFYLLAGQLYKYAGPAWRGLGACVHLHPQLGVPPLADLSRLEGETLLRVVAHKKPPQTAVFDSSKPQFDIQVKTLTGQWLPFKVCGSMLLEEFKEMMQDAEGIPPDMQRYIFRGIQLEDGYTLSYYGLDSTAAELAAQGQGQVPVLHLVLRLRGGMYHETSGRHDNESMSAEPLTHTEVTVAVPGFGELQLTVPVDVSGPQLLQLVQQRVQTDSAAAQAPVAVIDLVSTDEEDDADAEEASLQPQKTAAAAAAAEHDGRHSKRQRC